VSLAFWGMIWGIVGMIMAIPIMSVVVIICSQIPSARFVAILLSEKGEILKRTTN
jgi:predicted PurR-regulated permease PerM